MNASPGDGLGKGMIVASWMLLLLLLTLFFTGVLERRENPNSTPVGGVSSQGVKEVVLKRNVQGHYVASGMINGYPVIFLLDTGATHVAVSEALASKLGLEKHGDAFSRTANGVVAVRQTVLDRVTLGVIEMHNVRATILPELKPADQVLLGMSFLKKLELVQRDGSLTLRQLP
ncbi:MAG TPA: TIGR02281 family clan AA aspartic protease [Thiolapillus brandeum]|uniref:TIGR02281 family clan AA aspartic protease n=1 Tax=Thiolapillus brandeum TaxID=1076588 RepID=A0A831NTE4_9GAMM|nr:TIGR02281 family clan AA aspartic protease [Thiolapillus brandeum]